MKLQEILSSMQSFKSVVGRVPLEIGDKMYTEPLLVQFSLLIRIVLNVALKASNEVHVKNVTKEN